MILMMSIMFLFCVYVFALTSEKRNNGAVYVKGVPVPSDTVIAIVKGARLTSVSFGEKALSEFGYGTSFRYLKESQLTHKLCPITNEIYRISNTPKFIKDEMKIAEQLGALPWGHTPVYEDKLKHLLVEILENEYNTYISEYTYNQRFPNLYDLCPGFLSLGYELKNKEDISLINETDIIGLEILLDFDVYENRDVENDNKMYMYNKLMFFRRWCENFIDIEVENMESIDELEVVLGYSLKIHSYFDGHSSDPYNLPLEIWKVRFLSFDKKTRLKFINSFGKCDSFEVLTPYIKTYSYYECIDALRDKINLKK